MGHLLLFVPPSWDLPLVLHDLAGPTCEPLAICPIKLLTLKTVFLTAITSARRVSEIAGLSMSHEFCSIQEDRIVLHTNPAFLPKVNSAFHRSQEIVLPLFCPKSTHPRKQEWHLSDVRHAVSFYLQCTSSFRRTEVLFFSFKGSSKGHRPSSISRWVKEVIVLAYRASQHIMHGPPWRRFVGLPRGPRLTPSSCTTSLNGTPWRTRPLQGAFFRV